MILTFTPLVYGEYETLRYESFEFAPNYEAGSVDIKMVLEQGLDEFHYVEKLSTAIIDGNSMSLYRTRVKDRFAKKFREKVNHKKYVLKQKRDYRDRSSWDAVSFIDADGNIEDLSFAELGRYFSVKGRRDYDYYGCIDNRPVYSAPLIEGEHDYFFVIAATQGSPVDPLVSDYMELSIFSSEGDIQLTEKIFWANFYPTKKGPKVHFYG